MTDANPRFGRPTSEEEVDHHLKEFGPLIRRLEQAEAEVDPIFAADLRARLVGGEELRPDPAFARQLRDRLTTASGAHPLRRGQRRPWLAGLGTLVVAAVVAAVLLHGGGGQPAQTPQIPAPTRSSLLMNLPPPPGVTVHIDPLTSLIHPSSASAFQGHLVLHAPPLSTRATAVPAFGLARPRLARGARTWLELSAPFHLVRAGGEQWQVAAAGGGTTNRPLQSLAFSGTTGQLIYHDRRNGQLRYAQRPLDRRHAIGAARHWLAALGWSPGRMPLLSAGLQPGMPLVRRVVFGWQGVVSAAIPNATLWVTPNGSVIEGWVWPPVDQHWRILVRSVAAAWAQVRQGRVPIVVPGQIARAADRGSGRLHQRSLVSILVQGAQHRLYLVPSYRFAGRAHLLGQSSSFSWSSLAPAGLR